MATIKNTIKLQDKMTPVLRQIMRALDSSVDLMASVDNVSKTSFDKMKKDVQQAKAALDNFNDGADDIPKTAQKAEAAFTRWKNPLVTASALIYSVKNAVQGIGSVTKGMDDFTLSVARIGLVNDSMNEGLYTTAELQDKILASANRSRSAYEDSASAVGRLGLLAGDSFNGMDEIIAFTEIMNKAFKVSGASGQEASSAMYQISQAMAAGKLQGDEFRSIMENAPMVADAIATYMGKTKGELKEMSSEGLISADIIKAALFQAAGDIEGKYQQLPKTWGDSMTVMKNSALEILQPIIEKFNEIANSEKFQQLQVKILQFVSQIAQWALVAIDFIGQIMTFVQQNSSLVVGAINGIIAAIALYEAVSLLAAAKVALAWAAAHWQILLLMGIAAALVMAWNNVGGAGKVLIVVIGAIVAGVVAWTIAQKVLNAALNKNPIGAIIMVIAGLIAVIVAVVKWVMHLWQTNLDFKYGVIGIWNSILAFFDKVPLFFKKIGNGIADFFGETKIEVLEIMQGMVNGAIDCINDLIGYLNKIPGVSIDAIEHVTFAAEAGAIEEAKRQARANELADAEKAVDNKIALRKAETEAAKSAEEKALAEKQAKSESEKTESDYEKLLEGLEGNEGEEPFNWEEIMAGIPITGGDLDSVGRIDDAVEITEDDLKYLKDVAQMEFVNKYTTLRPELKVNFGDVHETADVNGILTAMEEMIEEAYATSLVD